MVIQHNMSAMNASRQLGLVNGGLAKSAEKLSSGYKINRAADDAAGLCISEKMRKQVRGLNQASENIEDGISLCQVADGALNETIDILQRMRELAVKAANGTNSASDRQSIEMEITQLKSEIDRIAETTKFNDAVYPLNAPVMNRSIVTKTATNTAPPDIILYEQTVTYEVYKSGIIDGKYYNAGDTVSVTGITTNDCEFIILNHALLHKDGVDVINPSVDPIYSLKKSDLKLDKDGHIYFDNEIIGKVYLLYYAWRTPGASTLTGMHPNHVAHSINDGSHQYLTAENLKGNQKTDTEQYAILYDSVSVHAGASSSQANKIPIHTVNATCKGLGIEDLTVLADNNSVEYDTMESHGTITTVVTKDDSTKALRLLDTAITIASAYRSSFGAAQNRLEHAQLIDDNTAENTQAAESQIRDTDMVVEMVRYSNRSILAQACQSMLAQANQSSQGVLSLIA